MYPTLSLSGDLILNSPLLLALRPLARGTLVTAVSPLNPAHQVLKRVVGLGGDTVLLDPSGERGGPEEWVKVPRGSVWLAGDNASNSIDSRDYGPVPVGLVKGVVVAKVSEPPGVGSALSDGWRGGEERRGLTGLTDCRFGRRWSGSRPTCSQSAQPSKPDQLLRRCSLLAHELQFRRGLAGGWRACYSYSSRRPGDKLRPLAPVKLAGW